MALCYQENQDKGQAVYTTEKLSVRGPQQKGKERAMLMVGRAVRSCWYGKFFVGVPMPVRTVFISVQFQALKHTGGAFLESCSLSLLRWRCRVRQSLRSSYIAGLLDALSGISVQKLRADTKQSQAHTKEHLRRYVHSYRIFGPFYPIPPTSFALPPEIQHSRCCFR